VFKVVVLHGQQCLYIIVFCLPLVTGHSAAAGFIDLNAYPYMSDVSNDNTLTINAFASLPQRLSYFSLSNFANQQDRNELSEFDAYYTEQNLRWKVSDTSPFDLTLQLNFRTGKDNNRHRLGVRWRFNDSDIFQAFFKRLNLSYSINFHLIQFDHEAGNVWQMEHVIALKFPAISERLYLAGFIDHTFNQQLPASFPKHPVVAEFQLGYRLVNEFYLIAEYRINQYRRSDVNNLALGVEYKVLW
jgi:hypothetical protein